MYLKTKFDLSRKSFRITIFIFVIVCVCIFFSIWEYGGGLGNLYAYDFKTKKVTKASHDHGQQKHEKKC